MKHRFALDLVLDIHHEGVNNVFLRLEVIVDGALADVGRGSDLIDGGRLDAARSEDPDRCLDDPLAVGLFIDLSPGKKIPGAQEMASGSGALR